jgi:hypothetical protein
MIEKLLHIFPVGEILEVLEANEVQRPVTIRYEPNIFPLPQFSSKNSFMSFRTVVCCISDPD